MPETLPASVRVARRVVPLFVVVADVVPPISPMHLYNLTLQHATAAPHSIVGNFSGARQQEIIVSHGTRLELLRPDFQTGKVVTVVATDVFGSIRSLVAFRLTGGNKGERLYVSHLTSSHLLCPQTMPS
jgi:hypothetical protein